MGKGVKADLSRISASHTSTWHCDPEPGFNRGWAVNAEKFHWMQG
jgi:hypothetical protein